MGLLQRRPSGCVQYKQSPLTPERQHPGTVALRGPRPPIGRFCPPDALLRGATAEVIHYNCSPRIRSILVRKICAIPTIGYFDGSGALVPEALADKALATFGRLCEAINIRLKISKSQVGAKMVFLGLTGSSPRPSKTMALRISLPKEKRSNRSKMTARIIETAAIAFAETESAVGRLSFALSSVFGRIGRAKLTPQYKQLHSETYLPLLSQKELITMRWWDVALTHMGPSQIRQRHPPLNESFIRTPQVGRNVLRHRCWLTRHLRGLKYRRPHNGF